MTLKTFFEKFDTFADAFDAVTKMRELVLHLAVQGKLVSQDKRDEPARLMLGEGKWDQLNKRQSIDQKNFPYSVPTNWIWENLDSLAVIERGGSPRPIEAFITDDPDGLNWIKIGDTEKGGKYITSTRQKIKREGLNKTRKVYPGDFLLTNSMSFGRPYISKIEGCIHDGWLRIHPVKQIDPDYLYSLLSSPYVYSFFCKSAAGAVVQNLNADKVRLLPIPLPPLAEQKRIVAKVDELMALCDRLEAEQQERQEKHAALARASLARFAEAPTPANLNLLFHKSYTIPPADLRKSILTLAVQGKLVSHCRETPKLAELEIAKTGLCEEEGIRKRPPVERVSRKDWGHFLPKHWALPNFDDVLVIVSGVTKGRVLTGRKTVTVPYLRVANVQRRYLNLDVLKEIEVLPEDLERYSLEAGDVLMTEGGDWDKVGRAAVWREEIEGCIHQNHVYRIRSPRKIDLIPEWIECYVNSPVGRSFFESASKQTTNLASINMTQLRGCPLPLPPSDEQRRIVAKVDELMALVDELETQLVTARTSATHLLEAVVAELAMSPAERASPGCLSMEKSSLA